MDPHPDRRFGRRQAGLDGSTTRRLARNPRLALEDTAGSRTDRRAHQPRRRTRAAEAGAEETGAGAGETEGVPSTGWIRVLLVTAVRLYREGLEQALGRSDRIRVVGSASSSDEALGAVAVLRPDIVLLDSPPTAGRFAVKSLVEIDPSVRVVALGVDEDEEEVLGWAEAGAWGFVSGESSIDELVEVVDSVARGEQPCSARIAGALLRRIASLAADREAPLDGLTLTRRQKQVMDLVDQGLSNKEIARALSISLPTVKNHVHHVYEKLRVHQRADGIKRPGRQYRFDSLADG